MAGTDSVAAKYASDGSESGEKPLKVCAEAGRKCVRNIQQYPVLSVEWIALVDSLKQLTRLVQLEGRMPANAKVSECQGRNADSDGTLWDQEQHENAIRILVEEAKVNLCLRMMNDYKKWQYNAVARGETIQRATQTLDYNETQLNQKCVQFEESLGLLLWRALSHVETLQLMDIPLLIEHIALVISDSGVGGQEDLRAVKFQENVGLYYFASLMKHSEKLNNSELLAKAQEQNIVHYALYKVLTNGTQYPSELNLAVLEGFSAMADNEDFGTRWEGFFPDDNSRAQFLRLENELVAPILAENPDKKRELRPLLDFFRRLERGR